MKPERNIINVMLVTCLFLGFICFADVYLPAELAKEQLVSPAKNTAPVENLSSIIELPNSQQANAAAPIIPENGIVAHFTPEQPRAAQQETAAAPQIAVQRTSFYTAPVTKKHQRSRLSKAVNKQAAYPLWLNPPAEIERDIEFWRNVYAKWNSSQAVFHDAKHIWIIYKTHDLSHIDNDNSLSDETKAELRETEMEDIKLELKTTLKKFHTFNTAANLTDEEWKIWRQYREINEPNKFLAAADRVRAQTGLRDKFKAGLKYSGRYLGEIEGILAKREMPRELASLIFVESMFNPHAHSSANAFGIWQFMHNSALHYNLQINHLVDERADPIKSTQAAADLLADNYQTLKTWPLAINAYNAGKGRMSQAVQQLGTRDIGKIVRHFKHRRYGFASRNFFPSFLAAFQTIENRKNYFGYLEYDEPLQYDIIKLHYHILVPDVAADSEVTLKSIIELNPGLSAAVLTGKVYLPKGKIIRLPKNKGEQFLIATEHCQSSRLGELIYQAKRRQSIKSIARAYGISPHQLRQANRSLGSRVKSGQTLKIPEVL